MREGETTVSDLPTTVSRPEDCSDRLGGFRLDLRDPGLTGRPHLRLKGSYTDSGASAHTV